MKPAIYFAASALTTLVANDYVSAASGSGGPGDKERKHSVEPSTSTQTIPNTKPNYGSLGPPSIAPPQVTYVPVPPKQIYDETNLGRIICFALQSRFDATYTRDCSKWVINKTQTVMFQVLNCSVAKSCEFEILGKSADLALGDPRWVERHRFFVVTGFDGAQTMSITISDFEPMLRTTPELLPVNEALFEYIDRKNDSALRVFQSRILSSIMEVIQDIFRSYNKPS